MSVVILFASQKGCCESIAFDIGSDLSSLKLCNNVEVFALDMFLRKVNE
jgi:hypothetical protein